MTGKGYLYSPRRQHRIHRKQRKQSLMLLLYRPPDQAFFCLEPVTHPIDAFHLPDRPGLRVLRTGESLAMQVQWRFTLSC